MEQEKIITKFHIVCAEDHPVLFGLSTLRYLGLFVEHLLVVFEVVRVRPLHMIKKSDTQTKEGTLQDLERTLEVPKVRDMFCSTPASEDFCQRDLPKTQEWCQLMLRQFKESHGNNVHANTDTDIHYNVMKDMYVPESIGGLRWI